MNKRDIQSFFDKCASWWDEDMVRNDEIINRILDYAHVEEGLDVLDQTTPSMIQRISGSFERKPLISKEI